MTESVVASELSVELVLAVSDGKVSSVTSGEYWGKSKLSPGVPGGETSSLSEVIITSLRSWAKAWICEELNNIKNVRTKDIKLFSFLFSF